MHRGEYKGAWSHFSPHTRVMRCVRIPVVRAVRGWTWGQEEQAVKRLPLSVVLKASSARFYTSCSRRWTEMANVLMSMTASGLVFWINRRQGWCKEENLKRIRSASSLRRVLVNTLWYPPPIQNKQLNMIMAVLEDCTYNGDALADKIFFFLRNTV